MTNQLRFAPIIRVSTEKQRDKGKSLETQKAQIIKYVELLNGVIPDECWKYCGQEHSTPGYERKLLDQLLSDSSKNIFDAVIVIEPSRWSRDNQKSQIGLDILDRNNIQFYAGTTRYVINSKKDPVSYYMLSNFVALSQMVAHQMANKSVENRQTAWDDGIPCVSMLPYGRDYDRKTHTWKIIEEKKEKIERAVDLFLSGKGRDEIVEILDLNISANTLWTIFRNYLGDTWTTKKMGTMKIPPLIDDPDKIEAVHRRIENNKIITRDPRGKHAYLLSGMIFCEDCGLTMNGVPNVLNKNKTDESKFKYQYRHPINDKRTCPNMKAWDVPAADIEEAVMSNIYSRLGNKEAVEKALADAIPEADKKVAMRLEIVELKKEWTRLDNSEIRLIEHVRDGFISGPIVKVEQEQIKAKKKEKEEEISLKESALENILSRQEQDKYAKSIASVMVYMAEQKSYEDYLRMPFVTKRRLLESIFTGKDPQGKRFGVYIKSEKKGHWRSFSYSIYGNGVGIINGAIPMDEGWRSELLKIPTEYDYIDDWHETTSRSSIYP
jgi:site-specific DNA recombinase